MRKFYISALVIALTSTLYAQQVPLRKQGYTQAKQVSCTPPVRDTGTGAEEKLTNPKPNIGISGSAKSAVLWEQVIGYTTYDNQANNSLQDRIIVDDNGEVHASWTISMENNTTWSDRGTGYNSGAGYVWDEIPYDRLEAERAGWPGLFKTANNGEAFVCHTSAGALNISKRATAGTGTWSFNTIPTDIGLDVIWPRAIADGNYIHVIAMAAPIGYGGAEVNGVDGNILYWRSSDNGQTWDIQDHIFAQIDSAEYADIEADSYSLDARGGKVSIAIFSEDHDSMIITSDDNGDTWNSMIFMDFPIPGYIGDHVTDVGNDGIIDTVMTTDGAGNVFIDGNGITHVSFGEFAFVDDTEGDSLYTLFLTDRLLYWNNTFDTDEIFVIGTIEESPDDDNETNDITWEENPDYRACLASMPSMGEDEDGYLYIAFSAADEQYLGDQVRRHIYVITSDDSGTTWSTQVELTPDLDVYEYEYVFPSLSRVVDDNLHIVVQRDTEPGLSVRGDLDPSEENDIVYLAVSKDLDTTIDIEEITEAPDFQLYPNPSNGNVMIAGENLGGMFLKVYDKQGREVVNTKLGKNFNSKDAQSFDFSTLPAGVYTVTLSNGTQKMSKEMMIK